MFKNTHFQRETLRFVEESPLNGRASPKPGSLFRRTFVASLILSSFVGFAGCGKKGPVRVQVFPVEGQVTFQGKPLANAQIFLHPKAAGDKSPPAQARTDNEGKFKVTTYDTNDGAAPGEYAITIEQRPVVKSEDGYSFGPNILPSKLAAPKTTDWKIQVAEQPNVLPVKAIVR